MLLAHRLDTKNIELLKDFDRYEGSRRTEIKVYDKVVEYNGFEIKRNCYIPIGAEGYWEVPELHYITIGGVKKGFLSVSKKQCMEAIDKYQELNLLLHE